MGVHERNEDNDEPKLGDPTPEAQEATTGSLVPIEGTAAQQTFAEITAGVDLSHVLRRQTPTIEELEKGASDFFRDVGTGTLILLGYVDDLKYRRTSEQGMIAYLRAVEITAQAKGVEIPVLDTPVQDVFDNSLLGPDDNIRELVRQQITSDQSHKRFSDLTQGVKSDEQRAPVSFVNSKRFYMDADAMRQRYPALKRGFDAIYERERAYVEAYRQSPLYVDEAHERAFLVPSSIIHPMVRVKEEFSNFQRALGE